MQKYSDKASGKRRVVDVIRDLERKGFFGATILPPNIIIIVGEDLLRTNVEVLLRIEVIATPSLRKQGKLIVRIFEEIRDDPRNPFRLEVFLNPYKESDRRILEELVKRRYIITATKTKAMKVNLREHNIQLISKVLELTRGGKLSEEEFAKAKQEFIVMTEL